MGKKTATVFFVEDRQACQLYHDTIVTRQGEDEGGTYVRCFTDGWRTYSTKDRINDILEPLGARVFADRGRWYVRWFGLPEVVVPFTEGIKVYAEGKVA